MATLTRRAINNIKDVTSENIKKSDVYVYTNKYVTSHGKEPKGRGCWAFQFGRNANIKDVFFTSTMTYSEAKKKAIEEAVKRKETMVYALG